MARPSLLERDPKLSERLCERIAAGVSYRTAAMSEGMSYHTLNDYRKRGLDDREAGRDTIYAKFLTDLDAAEAASLEALERKYHKLSAGKVESETMEYDGSGALVKRTVTLKDSPNAVGWLLERRMRAEYGAKQEIKHEGEVGGKVIILDPGKEEDGPDKHDS